MDIGVLVCVSFLIGVICLFGGCIVAIVTEYSVVDIMYYDLYRVTCPFGVWHTSGSGSVFLLAAEFNLDLKESYVIKYFDGRFLKTEIMDARDVSIIVDGSFRLEKITTVHMGKFWFLYPMHIHNETSFIIHLPYLPTINETMTNDWIRP